MGGLLGGSKQKSTSSNQAYGDIKSAFAPVMGTTGQSTNAISALLGLGGDTDGQNAAFDNYRKNTGYDFAMDQGSRAITGSAAAKGLLGSGSTAKALTSFGQNLANQNFGSYLDQLFKLGQTGIQAGQVLGGAGQTSTSTSKNKKGLGGLVGGGLSMMASGGAL